MGGKRRADGTIHAIVPAAGLNFHDGGIGAGSFVDSLLGAIYNFFGRVRNSAESIQNHKMGETIKSLQKSNIKVRRR